MSCCSRSERMWTRRETLASVVAAPFAGSLRAASSPAAPVAIERCDSYRTAELDEKVATLLDSLGGIEKLVSGKTVTVKLNLTGSPAQRFQGRPLGVTHYTHPNLIGVVCRRLDKAGAKRIILAESAYCTAAPLEEYMLDSGWSVRSLQRSARRLELQNTNALCGAKAYKKVKVPGGGRMFDSFLLHPDYVDTDVFVTLAKLKNHYTCGVTLSLKNSFGITPSSIYGGDAGEHEPNEQPATGRSPLHRGDRQPSSIAAPEKDPSTPRHGGYRVPRIVADLAAARPIELQIIDGVETMIGGEGPWVRTPLRVGKPRVLIAGLNPVSTDAAAAAVMGYDPRAERGTNPFRNCDNTLLLAERAGVGSADLSRIDVRGLSVAEARFPFDPALGAGADKS